MDYLPKKCQRYLANRGLPYEQLEEGLKRPSFCVTSSCLKESMTLLRQTFSSYYRQDFLTVHLTCFTHCHGFD